MSQEQQKSPSKRRGLNRRQFVQTSAVAAGGFGVWVSTGTAFGADDSKSPNQQVNVASIGVGGKGRSDTEQAGKHGKVVAICDVDEKTLASAAEKFPDAEQFTDYRELIARMGDKIDAVTISTPDHNHAAAAMLAIKAGKHVYVQKPLTWSIAEARALRAAAKEKGVITQMGNQGSASDGLRSGVEAIQAGAIGAVREVHVWTNRPVWPQAPKITARPPAKPVPATLNWECWIGPAPMREFHDSLHPFNWRGWWDFGTGALGDMWCHTANLAYRALKLEHALSVVGESTDINPETYPSGATATWEFAARGDMPALVWHWYEGKLAGTKDAEGKDVPGMKRLPPVELFHGEKIVSSGSILVGEKGVLYSPDDYGEQWKLLPKEKFADFKQPEKTLPRNGGGDEGMKKEWIQAIKGDGQTYSGFEIAAPFTETALLGNVAIRLQGKKATWDGAAGKFTGENAAEANKLLAREYRKGWTL
jgi:hypothetical protein